MDYLLTYRNLGLGLQGLYSATNCVVTIMNKQQQQKKSYKQLIYIHISCKCDTNRAGHFTLDAHASRPVACYILWESNDAGEARGQSWNESLKSRWIPGRSCGYTSGTKRKHFAALSSPRPCWRWLQLQPSCGPPQCIVGSDNSPSLSGHQAIIWTNAAILLISSFGRSKN